jgi:hypothetical protein
MPRSSGVDRGAPPAGILCDLWRHVERSQIGHEHRRVVTFVGAECDALRPRRIAHDHLFRRRALGSFGGLGQAGRDDETAAISISVCLMKLSLASLPRPLR